MKGGVVSQDQGSCEIMQFLCNARLGSIRRKRANRIARKHTLSASELRRVVFMAMQWLMMGMVPLPREKQAIRRIERIAWKMGIPSHRITDLARCCVKYLIQPESDTIPIPELTGHQQASALLHVMRFFLDDHVKLAGNNPGVEYTIVLALQTQIHALQQRHTQCTVPALSA